MQVLTDLHAEGACHGDVKPANLLLSASGRVKLVDFGSSQSIRGEPTAGSGTDLDHHGMAHLWQRQHESAIDVLHSSSVCRQSDEGTRLTIQKPHGTPARTQATPASELRRTLGTPAFMSPEASAGQPFQGDAADCWALGVCLYLAAFGRLPFSAPSVVQLFEIIRCAHSLLTIELCGSGRDMQRCYSCQQVSIPACRHSGAHRCDCDSNT